MVSKKRCPNCQSLKIVKNGSGDHGQRYRCRTYSRRLRSAVQSFLRNLPHLFTYERYSQLKIPTTTNALESHFFHIKDIVRIHRGLSRTLKQKLIHTILLNSSIVQQKKKIEWIYVPKMSIMPNIIHPPGVCSVAVRQWSQWYLCGTCL